jgi:hypothetical protein
LSKLTEEPLAATAIGEVDRKGLYLQLPYCCARMVLTAAVPFQETAEE